MRDDHLRLPSAGLMLLVCCGLSVFAGRAIAQAQAAPAAGAAVLPAPAQPSPVPVGLSLEARLAVARTVRVTTSIMDVTPGMSLEEAREKLDKLADPKTPPKQEGGEATEEKDGKDDDDALEKKGQERGVTQEKAAEKKDDDDDEGETKILWKLAAGAPYQWVFIKAGKDEKITAVYGYCWPDKPVPFDQVGDVSKAPFHSPVEVAWDSIKPPLHYRIVADGAKESASQVSIALVAVPMNGVHPPARQ